MARYIDVNYQDADICHLLTMNLHVVNNRQNRLKCHVKIILGIIASNNHFIILLFLKYTFNLVEYDKIIN